MNLWSLLPCGHGHGLVITAAANLQRLGQRLAQCALVVDQVHRDHGLAPGGGGGGGWRMADGGKQANKQLEIA